ncbi:hypothetical protein SAMN05192558_109228 [Actinokineospora alba]|uniref:Uncharacterized protein n=1 Tax=Actinokineospora alba TaxID=504798 RepID=A0A1H0T3H7_9PSEU|nr:hypothetical protein [Actinokineospora alba]TDP66405.1 hypothetical protein C8E96_1912 [Actinokineospora alba]SDJ24321.1 hypothetical protein SAMN05421871_111146 [Actinokineospora alba]SDP48088.1 hypothetical protein SAMN05192558_109228 [Actinokineospora alba]
MFRKLAIGLAAAATGLVGLGVPSAAAEPTKKCSESLTSLKDNLAALSAEAQAEEPDLATTTDLVSSFRTLVTTLQSDKCLPDVPPGEGVALDSCHEATAKLLSHLYSAVALVTTAEPKPAAVGTEAEGAAKALDELIEGECVKDEAPPEEPPAPPVEEPAPPVEEPAPPVEEPAPPVEEPAPPVEEPAPPVEEPAPPVEEPAPPVEEPAPPVEEPAPPVEEPAPPVEEPAPPVEEPAPPVVEEPAPPVEEPAPPIDEAPEPAPVP